MGEGRSGTFPYPSPTPGSALDGAKRLLARRLGILGSRQGLIYRIVTSTLTGFVTVCKRPCRGSATALVAFLAEIGPHGESISARSCQSAPYSHRAGRSLDRASNSVAGIKRTSRRRRDHLDIDLDIRHCDGDAQNHGQRLDQAEGAWGERITDPNARQYFDEPKSESDANADIDTNGNAHTHTDARANAHASPHANTNTSTHANTNTSTHACSRYRLRATKWQPASPERPNLPLRRT